MSFAFDRGMLYRMPAHFGPTPGPRQLPDGIVADHRNSPRRRLAAVSYLVPARQLEAILPPGFALWGEPVVTVELQYMAEIDWLAGRGYNTFGVKFPVTYGGRDGTVHGTFLSVLWENLADPILSGRDELGFNKIYCEIDEPRAMQGRYDFRCGWLGFTFFEMELRDLVETTAAPAPPDPRNAGTLHFKYIPRTGAPGKADAAYATLTPLANPLVTVERRTSAKGSFRFREARWEDLPTMHHIVNVFARLELIEFRGASLTWSRGGKDLGDQRIIEARKP